MRRKLFIPEVIQTSAMDCGPASLKALFGGFGLYLSYGRLREACQTDVDGASIDTLEEIANQLGLEASQTMMHPDLVLLPESDCLPAIAVVRLVGGGTHFVVAWSVHGPLIQVMDPSAGRVWMPRQRFLDSLYIHEQAVPRDAWDEWARSDRFQAALRQRIRGLECRVDLAAWPDIAHLDAALRFTGALSAAGQVRPGSDAADVLARAQANQGQIPDEFWTARPKPDDPSQVILRGAVLVQANGTPKEVDMASMPESLRAVLRDPAPRPWASVWTAIGQAGGR
jgi:ATP-binding cassette subfamily B protein